MTAGRLDAWVRRAPLGRGRWMTTLGGFLALQTMSVLAVAELQGRTADPDPALVTAGALVALVGLLLCGVGLPLMAHARRVRKWRQRYLLRLQDAKEWFTQGRLDEAGFTAARAALEEAAEGRFPGEARRTAGDVLRRAGVFLAAWALVAMVLGLRLPSGALLGAGAAGLASGLVLAMRGWTRLRAGKAATSAHLEALDAQEMELLQAVRSRTAPAGAR